jgi:hypothetical protein
MTVESIKTRIAKIRRGDRATVGTWALIGCPSGGWGETAQARQQLADTLPDRSRRSYTVTDLISALYALDHADRYQPREVAP